MKHLFSDLASFRRNPLAFFLERGSAASEPLVKLRMGFQPVYLIADPALIKPVMKADEADIDKGRLVHKLRRVLGDTSLIISGKAHKMRREAIHHHLARGVATAFIPEISALIREQAMFSAQQPSFDAHETTAALALRIISMILFGKNALTRGDENALVEAVHLIEDDLASDVFKILPASPWAAYSKKKRFRYGREMMGIVVERARIYATSTSLLRALEGLNLTIEELRDEILLLLLTGHHTTGNATAWLLYYLAIDPQLCDEVAQEAKAASNEAGEIDPGKFVRASLSQTIVREVLRLYPSAYWLSREVKRPLELAGIKLKPGTSLIISPWHMHRDPRFWQAPDTFLLGRSYSTPAYLPFGAGPRACVGMGLGLLEMQLICLELAAAFRIGILSQVPAPPPKPSITIVPPRIRLHLKSREDTRLAPGFAEDQAAMISLS